MSRVSIKGKGAELFFGEEAAQDDAPFEGSSAARQTDIVPAGQTARKPARKTERKTARQMDAAGDPRVDTVARLRQALFDEHRVHNTFRYSQADLDAVRDIVYELEVRRSIKATRNDVMRVGLAWIIDDYQANGPSSVLVAVLKQEDWRRGR